MPIQSITINETGLREKLLKGKTITFDPNINFIVGENGCGKSSLLAELTSPNKHTSKLEHDKGKFIFLDTETMNPRMQKHVRHAFDVVSHFHSHGETMMPVLEHMRKVSDNTTILIDEPEAGISPWNQKKLLKLFEEMSVKNQLIIATHSMIFTRTEIGKVIKLTKRTVKYFENPSTFKWGV